MRLSESQRSRSFFYLFKGHSDFKSKLFGFGQYTQVSDSGPHGPLVFSLLSSSLWETARDRLKYCLKRPLSPKQPTNQIEKTEATTGFSDTAVTSSQPHTTMSKSELRGSGFPSLSVGLNKFISHMQPLKSQAHDLAA